MIVAAEKRRHIVTGLAVLMQDQDAVGNAVRKLLLLGVQILERADGLLAGVIGHQIARVDVLAVRHGDSLAAAQIQGAAPAVHTGQLHRLDRRGNDLAKDLVAGLDVSGDGGLGRVDGVIVAQDSGRLDGRVVEIVNREFKFLERAEHTEGLDATELTLGNFHAAGQQRVMQSRGDKIALMDVPGAGADLYWCILAHLQLADQHMVGIGVLLQLQDLADLDVFHARREILRDLNLGAGDRHRLSKGLVVNLIQAQVHELVKPFSR